LRAFFQLVAVRRGERAAIDGFEFLDDGRVSDEKGALPSKLCRTMPSSRSPSERSVYSARPLRTFNSEVSMRTPVCVRCMTRFAMFPYLTGYIGKKVAI
jgi:hypothetical protein